MFFLAQSGSSSKSSRSASAPLTRCSASTGNLLSVSSAFFNSLQQHRFNQKLVVIFPPSLQEAAIEASAVQTRPVAVAGAAILCNNNRNTSSSSSRALAVSVAQSLVQQLQSHSMGFYIQDLQYSSLLALPIQQLLLHKLQANLLSHAGPLSSGDSTKPPLFYLLPGLSLQQKSVSGVAAATHESTIAAPLTTTGPTAGGGAAVSSAPFSSVSSAAACLPGCSAAAPAAAAAFNAHALHRLQEDCAQFVLKKESQQQLAHLFTGSSGPAATGNVAAVFSKEKLLLMRMDALLYQTLGLDSIIKTPHALRKTLPVGTKFVRVSLAHPAVLRHQKEANFSIQRLIKSNRTNQILSNSDTNEQGMTHSAEDSCQGESSPCFNSSSGPLHAVHEATATNALRQGNTETEAARSPKTAGRAAARPSPMYLQLQRALDRLLPGCFLVAVDPANAAQRAEEPPQQVAMRLQKAIEQLLQQHKSPKAAVFTTRLHVQMFAYPSPLQRLSHYAPSSTSSCDWKSSSIIDSRHADSHSHNSVDYYCTNSTNFPNSSSERRSCCVQDEVICTNSNNFLNPSGERRSCVQDEVIWLAEKEGPGAVQEDGCTHRNSCCSSENASQEVQFQKTALPQAEAEALLLRGCLWDVLYRQLRECTDTSSQHLCLDKNVSCFCSRVNCAVTSAAAAAAAGHKAAQEGSTGGYENKHNNNNKDTKNKKKSRSALLRYIGRRQKGNDSSAPSRQHAPAKPSTTEKNGLSPQHRLAGDQSSLLRRPWPNTSALSNDDSSSPSSCSTARIPSKLSSTGYSHNGSSSGTSSDTSSNTSSDSEQQQQEKEKEEEGAAGGAAAVDVVAFPGFLQPSLEAAAAALRLGKGADDSTAAAAAAATALPVQRRSSKGDIAALCMEFLGCVNLDIPFSKALREAPWLHCEAVQSSTSRSISDTTAAQSQQLHVLSVSGGLLHANGISAILQVFIKALTLANHKRHQRQPHSYIERQKEQQLYKEKQKREERDTEPPWFALSVFGVSECPVAFALNPHGEDLCSDSSCHIIGFLSEESGEGRAISFRTINASDATSACP